MGGPVTAPGYDFHSLVGRAALSQRLEWRMPVPFMSVSLGRFGRTPARAQLAPFATVVALDGTDVSNIRLGPAPPSLTNGGYPSVGVGLLTFFDLLRFDVARGLRNGRWTFSVDVTREYWSIL